MNTKMLMLTCASILMLGMGNSFANDLSDSDAQTPPRHEMQMHHKGGERHKMHGMRGKKLAEKLGLSEEQRQKAEAIRKADFEKMKPLMEQMKELREKMDNMRKENMKAFEEILTPEQKEKFEQMKKERSEKMARAKKEGKHRGRHFFKDVQDVPQGE